MTSRISLEDVRQFALDDANWDDFAALLAEVLPRHVRLRWYESVPYKRHFKAWQAAGVSILPNHYYSPIPDLNALPEGALTNPYPLHGIRFDPAEAKALLDDLARFGSETSAFRQRNTPTQDGRWYSGGAFGLIDAQVAYAMVRARKPKRIIEIGTGFSTLAMAEACELNAREGAPVEFTTVDPYPSFVLDLKPKGLTRNIDKGVETLPIDLFEGLEDNDILFIDSTHVIRPGGDVEYEYFHILPRLKKGVWIHIHDVFLPHPYPSNWITHEHIFWNEQQLLAAFLSYNDSFRTQLPLAWLCDIDLPALQAAIPGTGATPSPGSFWMRRIA